MFPGIFIYGEGKLLSSNNITHYSAWSTLYLDILYVYIALILLAIITKFLRFTLLYEMVLINKMRWMVMLTCYITGIFVFAGKALIITIGFLLESPMEILKISYQLVVYAQFILGGTFVGMQMPDFVYKLALWFFKKCKNLWILLNLVTVYKACKALSLKPSFLSFPNGVYVTDYLKGLDNLILQFSIVILDFRAKLIKTQNYISVDWVYQLIQMNNNLIYDDEVKYLVCLGAKIRTDNIVSVLNNILSYGSIRTLLSKSKNLLR